MRNAPSAALAFTVAVLALVARPAAGERLRSPRKPVAPVELTLSSRAAADGGTLVVLDAELARDVSAVELELGDEVAHFGATRAGTHRRLEAHVAVPPGGVDVIARVRTGSGTRIRTRVDALRLGPPAVQVARPTEIRTVFGRSVAEVRE